jgi:hypothetical protein
VQQEVSEQHAPPLQQGMAQQPAPCFFLWLMTSLAKVILALWFPSFAAFALAASQQGASQQATLQHEALHFEASQQLVFGAAKAAVTNVRARANPASLNEFNLISCV